jgi:hypothetical protein
MVRKDTAIPKSMCEEEDDQDTSEQDAKRLVEELEINLLNTRYAYGLENRTRFTVSSNASRQLFRTTLNHVDT